MNTSVVSRAAATGDRLVTTDFAQSGTKGFAAIGATEVAVRLIPGTELAFDRPVKYYRRFSLLRFCVDHKRAKFRRWAAGGSRAADDALEFPDGRIVMLAELAIGQTATVLQVPSQQSAAAS